MQGSVSGRWLIGVIALAEGSRCADSRAAALKIRDYLEPKAEHSGKLTSLFSAAAPAEARESLAKMAESYPDRDASEEQFLREVADWFEAGQNSAALPGRSPPGSLRSCLKGEEAKPR